MLPIWHRHPNPWSSDWNGFYVGGHFGYGWDKAKISTDGGFWGYGSDKQKLRDWLGGVQLGYWWHSDSGFAFGLDGSVSGTRMKDSNASPVYPDTDTWKTRVNTLGMVQGRAGWGNEAWLMFLQGGYAGVRGKAKAKSLIGPTSVSDKKWHNGWTIGAGVHYKVSQNFSLGAEYNYVDTKKKNYDWDVGAGERAKIDHDMHVFKIVGNIHFSGLLGR